METRFAFGKDNVVMWCVCVCVCALGPVLLVVWKTRDILSGQSQHPKELIEHDCVKMCGKSNTDGCAL